MAHFMPLISSYLSGLFTSSFLTFSGGIEKDIDMKWVKSPKYARNIGFFVDILSEILKY